MRRLCLVKCRECGEDFNRREAELRKTGFIDQCNRCAEGQLDVERWGANSIYTHKTAPEIEIKAMSEALAFAKKQRRYGAGVTMCLTTSKVQAHKSLNNFSPSDKDRDDEFTDKERKLS
jgi:hypothetical protein